MKESCTFHFWNYSRVLKSVWNAGLHWPGFWLGSSLENLKHVFVMLKSNHEFRNYFGLDPAIFLKTSDTGLLALTGNGFFGCMLCSIPRPLKINVCLCTG